jgi:hypothetical protein
MFPQGKTRFYGYQPASATADRLLVHLIIFAGKVKGAGPAVKTFSPPL